MKVLQQYFLPEKCSVDFEGCAIELLYSGRERSKEYILQGSKEKRSSS